VTAVETKASTQVRKFPLTTLIAMVVGSMVGADIFFSPSELVVLVITVAGFITGGRRPGDRCDHYPGRAE
jgi:hypothetical protein